jgi:CcmD family protein
MGSLLYLMLAYAAFWLVSFGFIFTIFTRQRKLDDEVLMLKQVLESRGED